MRVAVGLIVGKVIALTVLSYRLYLPPDFTSDFLLGRENYFFGSYAWAFYVHIFAGPLSLLCGMILLSERFRLRWPEWHRRLGKLQVANVVLLVSPSGLWMAQFVAEGMVARVGFSVLAVLTGLSAWMGWRAATSRRFAAHRQWMERCFALLGSAVVLRIMGGLASLLAPENPWIYPTSAWASWLIPLAFLEVSRITWSVRSGQRRRPASS